MFICGIQILVAKFMGGANPISSCKGNGHNSPLLAVGHGMKKKIDSMQIQYIVYRASKHIEILADRKSNLFSEQHALYIQRILFSNSNTKLFPLFIPFAKQHLNKPKMRIQNLNFAYLQCSILNLRNPKQHNS